MKFAIFVLLVVSVSAVNLDWKKSRKERDIVLNIEDFGAVGDGVTLNTDAFKAAIMKIEEHGGGTVLVPRGTFLTGPFALTSHMTLFLEENSVILATRDMTLFELTPPLPSYGQGRDHPGPRFEAVIHAEAVVDVVITGKNGTINGQGEVWWNAHNLGEEKFTRGHLVEFMYSRDIEISNLTFIDSPFWTTHLYDSENIHVTDMTILAPFDSPNTDGVDPDSAVNVLIENSYFATGDDGVAVKSGWDCFGYWYNKPTRDVWIRNLTVVSPANGVTIGSETSGGIFNVITTDCHFFRTGMRVKSDQFRGGAVRGIYFNDIRVDDAIDTVGAVSMDFGDPNPSCPPIRVPPVYDNIVFNRITGENNENGFRLVGLFDSIIENVFLTDINVQVFNNSFECEFVEGFSRNVTSPLPVCPEIDGPLTTNPPVVDM